MTWKNRIVGYGMEKIVDIIFNPWNWRLADFRLKSDKVPFCFLMTSTAKAY